MAKKHRSPSPAILKGVVVVILLLGRSHKPAQRFNIISIVRYFFLFNTSMFECSSRHVQKAHLSRTYIPSIIIIEHLIIAIYQLINIKLYNKKRQKQVTERQIE